MDELTGFQQQLAAALRRQAGSRRPVDAMAIAQRAMATAPRRRWPLPAARLPGGVPGNPTLRSPSVVSATRLIAAIALVALGTGALFLAASPGPSPAVSPSPSPTWDPLSGLVTEEVETGVLRVVRDDAGHDLASLGVIEIAVGADGGVWMNGRSGLFRLREPGIADSEPSRYRTGLTVGPDGSVWSNGEWRRRDRSVRSFDGTRWIYHSGPTVGALRNDQLVPPFAIGPDGSVWAAWVNALAPQSPRFELARLEGGRWVAVDLALTGWPDHLIGDANAVYGPGLVATDDGSLWLFASDGDDPGGDALARFDGRGWDLITIPSRVSQVLQLFAGPDGSIWAFIVDRESTASMARYTDEAWTFDETPPGIRPGVYFNTDDALRPVVASDGAVWIGRRGNTERLSQTGCDGLLRFDGTWTGYLADHCVHSVAAGPRGEAWVVAGPIDDQSGLPTATEVYRIAPRSSERSGE